MNATEIDSLQDEIARMVEELGTDAVDARPIDRDWSEGYGDWWKFLEAPCCQDCGGYAHWMDGEDLAKSIPDHVQDYRDRIEDADWLAWRCPNPECDSFGEEIDPLDGGAEGPMMNYAYPFPGSLDEDDASKIAHLPLCIVIRDGYDSGCELALTGGGMNLSWEICEAYVLLGQLPPAHFAGLSGMCGRGSLSSGGEYGTEPNARDALIIAACRRTAEVMLAQASNRHARIISNLDKI